MIQSSLTTLVNKLNDFASHSGCEVGYKQDSVRMILIEKRIDSLDVLYSELDDFQLKMQVELMVFQEEMDRELLEQFKLEIEEFCDLKSIPFLYNFNSLIYVSEGCTDFTPEFIVFLKEKS